MRSKLLFFFVLLSILLHAQENEKPDLSEAIRMIDIWLDAEKDYSHLPGISVAIVHDQEMVWSNAYGYADVEKKIPASTSTIYSICSISKLFTAIAIMQLRDAGKLSLEDHVEDLLPWYDLPQAHDDSGPVTVRSLLTHSSGLPRESNHPYWTGPDFPFPSSASIKSQLKEQETLYPASTYFQYSNLGLTLLGEIVAEVSGKSFDDYVYENIIQPLSMSDTRTDLPEEKWGNQLAKGYSALNRDGKRDVVKLFQAVGIKAAAGFSSTVEDLANFASWQFRLLENGGKEILKASTLKEMQRVHFMDPNWTTSWGLGFSVRQANGQTVVGHGGSCPGYRTQISLLPKKKLAVIVMINAQNVSTGKYVNGISQLINKAANGKVTPDSLQLEQYAGWYEAQPWGSEAVVLPWQGKLAYMSLPNNNPAESIMEMKKVEGDIFRRLRNKEELAEAIKFERDAVGNIISIWRHNNFDRRLRELE